MKQISFLLLYWLLIIFVSALKHIFFSLVLLLLSEYFLDPLSWCRDALSGNLGFVVPRRKKTETLFAYISVNPFVGLLEQRCCTGPRLWDVPGSTKGSERPTAANSSTDQTAGPFTFCYLFFQLFWMEINANMSAEVFLSQLCPLKCRLDIGLLLATYQTPQRARVQRSKETWLVVEYQPRWFVKLPSDKSEVMTVWFLSYTDTRLHAGLTVQNYETCIRHKCCHRIHSLDGPSLTFPSVSCVYIWVAGCSDSFRDKDAD